MKAFSLASRLSRDLSEKSLTDCTSDIHLELLDAINGGLQKLHALAPFQSKTTTGSLYTSAPETVALGVTNGSADITGYTFTADQTYRTIRIAGDDVDNQIVGDTELLHPYQGTTGTVSAVIYCDAISIPEPYEQMIGDPRVIETNRIIRNNDSFEGQGFPYSDRNVCEPRFYRMEGNAMNQNPPAPAVIRFDTLPDKAYRMESRFMLAPARITFPDMLSAVTDIPIRAELVEIYLLPVARGILSYSRLWRDKEEKNSARTAAESAEARYERLAPKNLATPRNRVRTRPGW